MSETQSRKDPKTEIAAQISDLSRLLGMIPADGAMPIRDPLTDQDVALAEWFGRARTSFLKLSLLVGRELDIQLQ